MTQQEQREFIMQLTTTLIQKKCYIRGYGSLHRVCDENHNPVINISKTLFNILVTNNVVRKDGLIYILDVATNPFKHYLEVKLPIKV